MLDVDSRLKLIYIQHEMLKCITIIDINMRWIKILQTDYIT